MSRNFFFYLLIWQDGTVQPDAFTTKLQKELNSSKQPGLAAFLKVSTHHTAKLRAEHCDDYHSFYLEYC